MKTLNYLLGYENLKIFQNDEMFRFSLDSVLLPNFITLNKTTKNILDIGTGNAPIPLILSTKTDAHITGVEIQKEAYELAIESVKYNRLDHQITVLNEDINEYMKHIETDTFDVITSNPPYFPLSEESHINESPYKVLARHESTLTLEDIMKISKKLLKNNGVIGIVNRPERLTTIIELMRKNNIEPKKMQLIYPKKGREANILLIEGRKNGKPGLKILSPLYSHEENGEYTEELKKYIKG